MRLTTTRRAPAGPGRATLLLAAALSGVLALSACGGDAEGDDADENTIHIVGFAVPEAANKNIATEFQKTDAGKDVKFETSYGASGDQSRAVAAGLEADYVHFSVPTDVTRLVDEGLVADDWDAGENKGVVSRSVVVFGVRDGNPKGIEDWDDLIKPGVEIVTAEPGVLGCSSLERPGRLRPGHQRRRHRGGGDRVHQHSSSRTSCRCPAAAGTPPPPSSAAPAT